MSRFDQQIRKVERSLAKSTAGYSIHEILTFCFSTLNVELLGVLLLREGRIKDCRVHIAHASRHSS